MEEQIERIERRISELEGEVLLVKHLLYQALIHMTSSHVLIESAEQELAYELEERNKPDAKPQTP